MPALVAVSGVGSGPAACAAHQLVQRGVTALLSWGTAGALDPDLEPGHIILPVSVRDVSGHSFATDRSWHETVLNSLTHRFRVSVGTLAQSNEVLANPASKARFRRECDAVAVDMESAAIAGQADEAKVPFLALRVVLDPADLHLPRCAVRCVDENGQISTTTLLAGLLRFPGDWASFLSLLGCYRAARQSMMRLLTTVDPHSLLRAQTAPKFDEIGSK